MLVDDNKLNLLVAGTLLKQNIPNVVIYKVESGEDAVSFLDSNSDVDIVLMDIQMGGITGIEATKIIKSKAPFNNLKIIALTAAVCNVEEVENFVSAGMSDYLSKPFDSIVLLKKLKKFI